MFIYTAISLEIAARFNSDAAEVVVYLNPNVSADYNTVSMCVWIVLNTNIEE